MFNRLKNNLKRNKMKKYDLYCWIWFAVLTILWLGFSAHLNLNVLPSYVITCYWTKFFGYYIPSLLLYYGLIVAGCQWLDNRLN